MRYALVIALALLSMGCSTEEVIGKADLEKAVSAQLTQNNHQHQKLVCDGDVKAQATETTRCTMTKDGAEYPVTVFVQSTEDGEASYDLRVGRPGD